MGGVLRHIHHRRRKLEQWLPTLLTTFTFLLFYSASAINTLTPQPSGGAVKHGEREEVDRGVMDQKRFSAPGSWPPSCRWKCGWCSPCEPVHVPVRPGFIIRLEYYPEAWRCKCGNKLFMP